MRSTASVTLACPRTGPARGGAFPLGGAAARDAVEHRRERTSWTYLLSMRPRRSDGLSMQEGGVPALDARPESTSDCEGLLCTEGAWPKTS